MSKFLKSRINDWRYAIRLKINQIKSLLISPNSKFVFINEKNWLHQYFFMIIILCFLRNKCLSGTWSNINYFNSFLCLKGQVFLIHSYHWIYFFPLEITVIYLLYKLFFYSLYYEYTLISCNKIQILYFHYLIYSCS